MSYRTAIAFLVFSLVVLGHSMSIYQHTGVITVNNPFNGSSTNANGTLQTNATLIVDYNRSISLCFVQAEYGLPHYTEYNEDNCLFFFNLTQPTTQYTVSLALRDIQYNVGVYFAGKPASDDAASYNVTVVAATCEYGQYWDKTSGCQNATQITETTFSFPFPALGTHFWTYIAHSHLHEINLKMESAIPAEELVVRARFMGNPETEYDFVDSAANRELIVSSPRPGLWVFYVHVLSATGGPVDFSIADTYCPPGHLGPDCRYIVSSPENNLNLTISGSSDPIVLNFTTEYTHALWVTVTTNNGSFIPYLYATLGQVPVPNMAPSLRSGQQKYISDIMNCNRPHCSLVRSIFYNSTAPGETQDWYVAIVGSVPGNVTFAVWWNQSCVPDCQKDNHGECEESGRCSCEIDFEGIDCGVSKGLGPQYIVLIIIASLVVASAIIGFVAWAYMRRKRANYEIVS
jgi:hypothetical protein